MGVGGAGGEGGEPPVVGPDPVIGTVGSPCPINGAYGCAGNAQRGQVVCVDGRWASNGSCASGQTCNTTGANIGFCDAILTECSGKAPGTTVCVGQEVQRCGPDLSTLESVQACKNQACVAGACTGVCAPKDTKCGVSALSTCNARGEWAAAVACPAATPTCVGAVCGTPPSCQSLAATCGPTAAKEACCSSPVVTGGSFYRMYDGVTAGYTVKTYAATVSDFRLDRFEVSVGRFRKFVTAWNGGWRPAAGDGKHKHLNSGAGVTDAASAMTSETGWDTTWVPNVVVSDTTLACNATYQSWTAAAGANEARAIVCVNWYEASAFCAWDGGFLPTEAEWNYAASGGVDQRVYPWSSPATSTLIDCTYAQYAGGASSALCVATASTTVGLLSPKGDGKFLQADLSGNAAEWTLDLSSTPTATCSNCANLLTGVTRVVRGGGGNAAVGAMLTSYRNALNPTVRNALTGFRCARP
ncbi:MAG: SUMF1/EgtB/PvdO family nonheme iron enzyme [Polyangiaceae bacterium]